MFYNDKLKLDNDLLHYLGERHIAQVDYNLMDTFIAEIHADKGLSQSSLKKYVILVLKVLKEAKRDGAIEHIPTLPTIKRTENSRPWFSPEQYALLLQTCRDLRDNTPERSEFDFRELYDSIALTPVREVRDKNFLVRQFATGRLICPKSNYGISKERPHICADAGEVLSNAALTANARVHQTVDNQAGP